MRGIRRREALLRKKKTTRICDVSFAQPDVDESQYKARLKSVVGRNASNVNSFALHYRSDTLLQVAGSSIIVSSTAYHDRLDGHLISSSKQTFTCVAVTECGRFAATGESGHNPCVRIWQLRDEQGNFIGRMIRSMPAHTVAINIVKFTPDDSTLISVGCQHDAQIITWDWRMGNDIGVGKLMSPVNALTISYDSSMCVTVGSKSVKYWFLPLASDGLNRRSGLQKSRSAILADKRNVNFVDATFCDMNNRLIAVTSSGEILEFNGNKKYVKCYSWKESGDFGAICVARIPEGLLVGCSDGLIRLFCLIGDDLDFLADLAPPNHLFTDPSEIYDTAQLQSHPEDAIFAEPRCIVSSRNSPSFVVGYADRSLVEFSRDNKQWSFRRASLSHVGSINHIESYPSTSPCLPAGTIITSGSDGTVRFWNFGSDSEEKKEISNILCPSLLKVIHIEENPDLLLDKRNLETVGPSDENVSPSSTGVICTKVAHDGRMMVAGTSTGQLHVIDLSFSDTPFLDSINAHDNEVTAIDFSDHATTSSNDHPIFLASGGRDRFVHIFRRVPFTSQFAHCAVLDAHQSAIKSIQFASNSGQLYLYTCASDRTLIIWKLDEFSNEKQQFNFSRIQQISTPSSISDMRLMKNIDLIVIAGHDRLLRQFDLNGKHVRDVKGTDDNVAQHGKIIKIGIDASGSYVCSVCSDKFVYVHDIRSGTCLAVLVGFGAPPTDAVFSDDFKNVYVSTSNGAIFTWRLAKNLTERMISAQVRLLEEITMRTSTPDSLLGSGSETISDSNSLSRPLGAPEFSGSSTSLCSDDDSTQFSSSVRGGSQRNNSTPSNWHPIGTSSYARVGDSSYSPTVQTAPAVERRTLTNIFASPDQYESEVSETQSDFISSRRKNRLFSEEEEPIDRSTNSYQNQYLAAPIGETRRSASPSLHPQTDQLRGYQSSKSMMNLREVSGGVRVPTAKELMMSHIAAQRNSQSGSSSHLSNGTSGRMKWGDIPLQNDWQPSSTSDIHHVLPAMATSMATPLRDHHGSSYNYADSTSPNPPPLAPRTSSRFLSTPPSKQALQQIQSNNNSPFRRKSMDRNSLSRKFLDNGGSQPKTVWSPQALSNNGGAPRRSNSNLFAAVNSESTTNLSRRNIDKPSQKLRFSTAIKNCKIPNDFLSEDENDRENNDSFVTSTTNSTPKRRIGGNIQGTRRPSTVTVDTRDTELARRRVGSHSPRKPAIPAHRGVVDETPFSLRSRSQSPNKLALLGSREIPSSPSSTAGSSVVNGRVFQQRRRDSDMSYVKGGRGRDEMRKSTDALNKLMAVRNKLHQSSENLRKSTENLALLKNLDESTLSTNQRTRSISNLRNAGTNGGNMEPFGTFDADIRNKSGSTSSLAQSRMLARSIGNLNDGMAIEGSMANREYESPGKRLANTIQMMKKASNPDLTAPEQFEETISPFGHKMRGAVQKKMDRYKQRKYAGGIGGRNQTSEESDSNNSDMMPSNLNKRALAAGNRSTTASDCSPASSTRSSSLASGGLIGSGMLGSRKYDQQQRGGFSMTTSLTTPRRTSGNYMVTKMSEQLNKSMEGPDLGSDDSPRSSVTAHEWRDLIENSHDGTKNPLICHVQDCMEQLRINVDKSIQAKKLVEDDTKLSIEQKKIVMCEIDRSIERVLEKLAPTSTKFEQNGNHTSPISGNDYSPMKGAHIYGILKENLTTRQ